MKTTHKLQTKMIEQNYLGDDIMKKILIVEDDLDIQEMIQFFLEDQNYQVCVADDGVDLVAIIKK